MHWLPTSSTRSSHSLDSFANYISMDYCVLYKDTDCSVETLINKLLNLKLQDLLSLGSAASPAGGTIVHLNRRSHCHVGALQEWDGP